MSLKGFVVGLRDLFERELNPRVLWNQHTDYKQRIVPLLEALESEEREIGKERLTETLFERMKVPLAGHQPN